MFEGEGDGEVAAYKGLSMEYIKSKFKKKNPEIGNGVYIKTMRFKIS